MSCGIFYNYGDRSDVGHESCRDEGWRKWTACSSCGRRLPVHVETETKREAKRGAKQSTGDGRPYRDGTYSSGIIGPTPQYGHRGLVVRAADGTGLVGNAKQGGIHNAFKPVVQPEEIRLLDDDDDAQDSAL